MQEMPYAHRFTVTRLLLPVASALVIGCVLLVGLAQIAYRAASPDVLAFASETRAGFDLLLLYSDGRSEVVGQGVGGVSHISWSPDGASFVYTSEPDLHIFDMQTRTTHNLTADRDLIHHAAAWSPAGDHIAFLTTGGYFPSLFVMDLRDGTVSRIGEWIIHGARPPVWSPDGMRLLFLGAAEFSSDVIITDAIGGDPRNLNSDSNLNDDATWSPDGRRVAYLERTLTYNQLEIVDLENGELEVAAYNNSFIGRPAWSPDGRWFAYLMRHGAGGYYLYMTDTSSGDTRRVLDRALPPSWLAWSPDSSRIVLLAYSRTGRVTPHLVDVARSLMAPLSHRRALYLNPPAWQPR